MFCRLIKLNIKQLSNDIVEINIFRNKQLKKNEELQIKVDSVLANQELIFCLVKKLADCFQLEYVDGKYISKRK
jgi:hypothetical protein